MFFEWEISNYNPKTPDTNCISKYLLKGRFLKIIGLQNQLPITFYSDLMLNKTIKAINSTPTHKFLTFDIPIAQ